MRAFTVRLASPTIALLGCVAASGALAQTFNPAPLVMTCNTVPFAQTSGTTPFGDLLPGGAAARYDVFTFYGAPRIFEAMGTDADSSVSDTVAVLKAPQTLTQDSPPDANAYWQSFTSQIGYNLGTTGPYLWSPSIGYTGDGGLTYFGKSRNSIYAFQYRFEIAPEVDQASLSLEKLLGVVATDPVARIYVNGQAVTPAALLTPYPANGLPDGTTDLTLTGAGDTAPVWRTGINTIEVAILYREWVMSNQGPSQDQVGFRMTGIAFNGNCDVPVTHTVTPIIQTGGNGTFAGTTLATGRVPAGTPVTIEILDAQGNVVDTMSTTTLADGTFTTPHTVNLSAGNYTSRPTVGNAAPDRVVGPAQLFEVKATAVPSINLQLNMASVVQNQPVVFSGVASNLPAGSPVTIDILDSQGQVVQTLGPVVTDATGAYSVTATVTAAPGSYQVRAQSANGGTPVQSALLPLTVTAVTPPTTATPTPVPGLAGWGLLLLTGLLGLAGVGGRRKLR